MALIKSPPLVLVLNGKSLTLYERRAGFIGKIEFAPNVINHLQIVSKRRFNSEIVSFLSRFKRQSVIILISPEIINSGKNILKTLTETLQRIGWKINKVIPEAIFVSLNNKEKYEKEDIEHILSRAKPFKNYNLVNFKNIGFNFSKNIYFLITAIMLLISGSLFFIYKNHPKPVQITAKVAPEPSAILSPSPELISPSPSPAFTPSPAASASAEIAKEDLKIEILNGSGITGQSSKLREKLLKEGYKNIETGNDFGNNNSSTVIIFSSKVPEDIRSSLIKFLKKSFSKISSSIDDTLVKFDIIITTAKQ